jgi:adenosylcobinamide-GDP ribazoletransferase
MKRILLAFQFLTIIPAWNMQNVSEKEMGGASAFFPIAGLVQGLLLGVLASLFLNIFSAELTNGFLIMVLVITNGGFHLDGLADTFDAIAAGGDREKKLAVMKDSTTGPIGVIAIVFAILLKYLLLNELFLNSSSLAYYSSLILMPVFSKWIMTAAIFHSKPARRDGLGKIFIENTGLVQLITATFLTLSFLVAVPYIGNSIITSNLCCSGLSPLFLKVMPVLYIFSIVAVWFSNKRFGGMTGDTFGAVSEISEILFLIMVITWSQGFI